MKGGCHCSQFDLVCLQTHRCQEVLAQFAQHPLWISQLLYSDGVANHIKLAAPALEAKE